MRDPFIMVVLIVLIVTVGNIIRAKMGVRRGRRGEEGQRRDRRDAADREPGGDTQLGWNGLPGAKPVEVTLRDEVDRGLVGRPLDRKADQPGDAVAEAQWPAAVDDRWRRHGASKRTP